MLNPFTEQATFNYQAFCETVQDSVVFLNEILDEGLDLLPLEEQRKGVGEWRQIGLIYQVN